MEESFPRGGTQVKSKEPAPPKRPREDDNLFSTRHEEETSVKKKKKVAVSGEELEAEPGWRERRLATKLKAVKLLSYKDLSVGMIFLGCIKDARDFELVVALPYGLTGYIQATNISPAYTQMLNQQVSTEEPLEGLLPLSALYSPGMLVRCVISNLETTSGGYNSIKLSLNPQLINEDLTPSSLRSGMLLSGLVSSVEDHGYLIDLGIAGTKAFLPHKKAQAYLQQANKDISLYVGQYLNCVIEEVKNKGRVCHLSILQSDVAAAIATDEQQWNLNNLLPGLVLKARIQKVLYDHITVSFLSSYTGVVDFLHFDAKKASSYQADQVVKACILWVDRSSKTVHLSLRKPFLQPGEALQQVSSHMIGSLVKSCKAKAFYKNVGALFTLDGEMTGFAFKRNLKSGDLEIATTFKEESVHAGRVVGFSPMDETHLLSFREDDVEGPFLKHEDLQAGQFLEGTVVSIEKEGMVVDVTQNLSGLVPKLHLADVYLQHPEKKYTPGKKIKCRILNVYPSAKKLILTCKKTLLDSPLPVISSFHDARPGLVAHGFITAVKDYGCVVKFYNDVHGLVPSRELSSEFIPSPEEVFYKGQVVKVRVLQCTPDTGSLILSFKILEDDKKQNQPEKLKRPKTSVLPERQPGKIVNVRIVSKTEDALNVLILPEETPAVLSKVHLSDHIEHCELLFSCFKEDDVLPGVMILNNLRDKIILTRKPALISSLEKGICVKNFSDLQVGMMMTGYVKTIMTYGVFVEFFNGLVGLVPISQISDKFVSRITDHVVVGKTVITKVTNIDVVKKRFLLTLKMTECAPHVYSEESFSRMSQYFTELQMFKDLMKRNEASEGDADTVLSLVPGKKLTLVVEEVPEDGPIEFACSRISGAKKILAVRHEGKELSAGQKVKAVVLHVDFLESHVYVSIADSLLKKSSVTLAEDSVHSAVVQHLAAEFAMVSLEDTSVLAAVPLSRHFNDSFRFESEKLSPGEEIVVRLLSAKADDLGLLLAVEATAAVSRKAPLNAAMEKQKPAIGELISGTVKRVRPTNVLVSLPDSLVGSIHASQISVCVAVGSVPTSSLKPQQSVTCRVIGGRDVKSNKFLPISHPNLKKSILELSMLPSVEKLGPKSINKFSRGEKVTCYVAKYNKERQSLEVEVVPGIHGQVDRLLLSPNFKVLKCPEKYFKPGQALSASVISSDLTHKLLTLSLTDALGVTEGQVLTGCVKSVNPASGLVISLPNGKTGRASLCQLSDSYEDVSVEKYKAGMFVRCCVLSIGKRDVSVSLRKSRVNPKEAGDVIDEDVSSIDALQEGQLIRGFVSAVNEKGVFFRISSTIDGHIAFTNATSYYVKKVETFKLYIPEGKLLTAKILSIDKEKKHIKLSLLSNDTGNPDLIPQSAGFELRFKANEKKRPRAKTESGVKSKKKKKEDEDSGVEVSGQEQEDEPNTQKSSAAKPPAPHLQVSAGFSWDVDLNTLKTSLADGKASSSDSEEDEEEKLPKKGQKKHPAKKQQPGTEASQSSQQPQSVNEFERLVLSSPNSSANWIQYMDFHLQATALEQAREVAERALQTIYFREEQEKLNVWAAMLKMENTYGTEESLMKTFERAVQYNDPLKAFQHLVEVYIEAEKYKEADELFNTMLKRFRQEMSVYWKYAQYLHKQGQSEASHRLLQRALKSLPEKEHVDVISKFAQLEFRMGDAVRAKALFESTLGSYPKRTDVWSIYIDMMVKYGSQKEVREIFERVIHLSLTAKRIKFFFKRYLEYEKKHGTEATVQAVKEAALKYVESKGSS